MELSTDSKSDIWTVLEHLERLEGNLEILYEWFSGLYQDDREAAALFEHLSFEEKSHLNIVKFGLRMVMKERKAFGRVDIDLARIKEALGLIETIRMTKPPPTLEQALEFTLQLEAYSCDGHYRASLQQANPQIAAMIGNITTSDKKHLDSVLAFAQKRGITMAELVDES
jgi:rubrerythrin